MQTEILVLSFISGVLVLFPLPWYCRAGNIAAVSIGIWLFVVNTINAIDALRWTGTYQIPSLIWCDISECFEIDSRRQLKFPVASALITAVNVAIPAACLCICIHLERMASFCQTSTSITKRRRILLECLICFGVPLVYAALRAYLPMGSPTMFIDIMNRSNCSTSTLWCVWKFWMSIGNISQCSDFVRGLDTATCSFSSYYIFLW